MDKDEVLSHIHSLLVREKEGLGGEINKVIEEYLRLSKKHVDIMTYLKENLK